MLCSSCGHVSPVASSHCPSCGASTGQGVVAAVVPVDTTGLPPGGSFEPVSPSERLAATTQMSADTGTLEGWASAGPLRVGQTFGPRYHIIKTLGVGGMGAVYQAWDEELSVAVAPKVIPTDVGGRGASSAAEKRFKQELLLARQVTHKHVVRIHDLGEIDGIKYLTMPYINGHDLATVLRRGGKLQV